MNSLPLAWLAAVAPDDLYDRRNPGGGLPLSDILTLAAILLAVGAAIFLVVYLVKRRDHEGAPTDDTAAGHHHHHHHRLFGHGRRRHKRLPQHRPRNPTLAETGGLPPLRPEKPPPPPAQA